MELREYWTILRRRWWIPVVLGLLVGAISFARDMGDTATALRHARTLAQAYPDDSQVRALVRQLEQAGGR